MRNAQEYSAAAQAAGSRGACGSTAQPMQPDAADPAGVGAGLVLDEHLLTNASRDQDYNGGGEVTLSGARTGAVPRVLDRMLGFVDRKSCGATGLPAMQDHASHALAAGLLVFTPRDLGSRTVVRGDRPYASLFFMSAGRRYTNPESNVAYDTSLTLGVLGLSAAGDVQRLLHDMTGSHQPHGWSHQISSGGEPTIRYELARQELLADLGRSLAWGQQVDLRHQSRYGDRGKYRGQRQVGPY